VARAPHRGRAATSREQQRAAARTRKRGDGSAPPGRGEDGTRAPVANPNTAVAVARDKNATGPNERSCDRRAVLERTCDVPRARVVEQEPPPTAGNEQPPAAGGELERAHRTARRERAAEPRLREGLAEHRLGSAVRLK